MGWKSKRGEMATIGGETKRRRSKKWTPRIPWCSLEDTSHCQDRHPDDLLSTCTSYKYSPWKISSCQLHRGQMYTERFFKSSRVIEVGPEVSWGRQGSQTKLFKPKKPPRSFVSHTFKGKLVPSIHLDEMQTISNLFQYYSDRNNKAQTEILPRPQHFIKGRKNLLC